MTELSPRARRSGRPTSTIWKPAAPAAPGRTSRAPPPSALGMAAEAVLLAPAAPCQLLCIEAKHLLHHHAEFMQQQQHGGPPPLSLRVGGVQGSAEA